MPKPKYKNYRELSDAFKAGELSKHHYVMLDKGGTENSLTYYDPEASDEENERKQLECAKLFEHPNREVEALFDALGIRWEWC